MPVDTDRVRFGRIREGTTRAHSSAEHTDSVAGLLGFRKARPAAGDEGGGSSDERGQRRADAPEEGGRLPAPGWAAPAGAAPTGAPGRSGRCCRARGSRPGARRSGGLRHAPPLLHVRRGVRGDGREGGRAGARPDRLPRPRGRAPARPGRASGRAGARRGGSPAPGCRRRRRPRSERRRAGSVSSSPRRIVLRGHHQNPRKDANREPADRSPWEILNVDFFVKIP
jgi:hypothetical protein